MKDTRLAYLLGLKHGEEGRRQPMLPENSSYCEGWQNGKKRMMCGEQRIQMEALNETV